MGELRRGGVAAAVAGALALLLPGAAVADHTMSGSIDAAGAIRGPSSPQAPGTHDFTVTDTADIHNYHLSGPGVNQATGVESTGTVTWTGLTFALGTYRFQCDVHPSLNGSFTVGSAPPPPPPPPPVAKPVTLRGSVGPGAKIDLKTAAGMRVKTVAAGVYLLVVADKSAADNFHLTGPGVNRKTGIKAKGTVRWTLRLKAGKHRYRSDAHAALGRTFTVKRMG